MSKLKVGWFGYGGSVPAVERLRPIINELGMELITIHEGHQNYTPDIVWHRHTYINEPKKFDIIVLPINLDKWPAKSANRLIQAMSLGKPVICSSLDAYKAIEEKHPGCCLFADTDSEWLTALKKLRDDVELRTDLSRRALIASESYSIDKIGEKWLNIFQNIERTDIVIPTYNNSAGLKLCIESITECTPELYNIIVVNNGTAEETEAYLNSCKKIVHIKTPRLTFAEAVNIGIRASKAEYIVILNDDTILSRGWLTKLIQTCKAYNAGAVGVLSNCDRGWLHSYSININGVELLPGINTIEQIRPIIPAIYDYKSQWTDVVEREWIAFYCTLIPRKVINEVGFLNERYINSGEDVDFCNRIRKKGYKIYQNYAAFVFHFGAVSRKVLEKADKNHYHESDRRTRAILAEIWSRKTVIIYTGPSWERWDFRNLDTGGIGGSETWAVELARSLSRLGYRVIVFADCPESGKKDGDIEYIHYCEWPKWIDQHWIDYCILSRTTDPLKFPVRAGKIFVISHDIWLLNDKNQTFIDKVEKFCVLSEWHRDFFADYHSIPKEKIWITSNGINLHRFDKKVERDPYRLIWSSSWDRGLDNVLYLLPFIREKIPQISLHVFYGCYTWEESCKRKGDTNGLKKIEELKLQMRQQPNVFNHGRISQDQLAEEFLKSSLWLYPTWFSETFSITAIESQAAGVPVLANNYAGLKTTVGDSGILLGNGDPWWPYTKEGREAFLAKTIELLTDRNEWQKWSDRGRENAKRYSWDEVAKKWQVLFERGL